ncbi:MAG: C25 family cysteine peptidase [Saprospiraceae bacterium]
MNNKVLTPILLFLATGLHAQMWNGVDTLYGNEWIDYSRIYYKIKVADDGIYRLDQQTLADAGFPVATIPAEQFRLYRNGEQVPLYVTTDAIAGDQDYIEFYGQKNRDELDRYLFGDPNSEQINPWYSLFNDTAAYYLTWETTSQALRYTALANNLDNLPPAEPYCWWTTQQIYNQSFVKRKRSDEITFSWFEGDGFSRAPSTLTNISLPPKKIFAAGPDARLTVRYACLEGLQHQQRIFLNDVQLVEDTIAGWGIVHRDIDIATSLIAANANVKIQSAIGGNDRHALAGAMLQYPRLFDFENATQAIFTLEPSDVDQYLEIQAFSTVGGTPVLYDLTNQTRLVTTVEGGVVKAKIPPSSTERRLLLAATSAIHTQEVLTPVQFSDYSDLNADYVIITNASLRNDPVAAGADHIAEYAAYRESPSGGNHKVAILDVKDLYEQYAYGVRFHPIAIRNFLHDAARKWTGFHQVFIIGKGLDYSQFRTSTAQNNLIDSLFFVPTYGSPAADIPFVLSGNRLSKPVASIGRLAVTNPSEIKTYLDKVRSHELALLNADQTLEEKEWMKRVIHNSGGLAGESDAIRVYTTTMANNLANSRFGADVHSFYKTSNDPIQLSSYEQMLELIDGGVSLWTIFGHSSAFAVDFDIGTPSVYNNKGRYPLLMVMGCFSGICSSPQKGIGEQFVLAPDRGAIAYIASVNYSYISALYTYGLKYYELLGGTDYGKSVGDILTDAVDQLQGSNYDALIALLHQNLLQGDPAVRIHTQPGPDYLVDKQSVVFNPNPVGLEQNTFTLQFDVANIGEYIPDKIALKVEQRLPDNTVLQRLSDTIDTPPFRRQLDYTFPVSGSQIGFNRFLITLDPGNTIEEKPFAAELNNELTDANGQKGVDVYFYSDDVQPVFPPPYGIVSQDKPMLWASTLNFNAAPLRYLFEIDTLETFNSPFKKSGQLLQRGGLMGWAPDLPMIDSTVYYWRVARDSLVNGEVVWRTNSFIYLPGSAAGWNQSNFGQYRDGIFANMQAVDSTRRLEFQDNAAFVTLTVAFRDMNRYPGFQNSYYEGFVGDYGWNVRGVYDGVVMVLSNPNTGRFVLNPEQGNNNYDPPDRRFVFWFNTRDSLERVKLMQFVENGIPDGYYAALLAFSRPWDTVGYSPKKWAADSITYGKNLFSVLENQGAKKVRTLAQYSTSPRPYGFIFRKNDPAYPVQDTIVFNPDSAATLRASFLAKWTNGLMETPAFGPVRNWKSLHWQREAFDDASDFAEVTVWGVRAGLDDTLLLVLKDVYDTSLAFIPATQFPLLKLRYSTGDTLTRSLTQLGYLRVLYDALPEGAMHPVAGYSFYKDTLQQGENMHMSIVFANISDQPMDSLLVRFNIENAGGDDLEVLKMHRPLPPGDTLQLKLDAGTYTLSGPQRLLIDVNPGTIQPELYHFNNVGVQDFYVMRDNRNPLLDVTFDGSHILDGDIVSPKPLIAATLKDDNRFLAITDTATFDLKLEMPDGSLKNISPSDPDVMFFPADASDLTKKNAARIEWSPVFTLDGDYRLLVNGRDATGNESAGLDYAIRFKVITHSSLSNLLNYPNPFSTRTCFVYTMTGAEPPLHFKIQIMTVSGRIVREITEQEFGPLKPGTHQSDFCWDGRDEYGDQLANGVYLYRVIAKKADGTDFDLFDNDRVDGFFKRGFGKMVLIR